ncbi:MAG TPA: hypothetical protein VF815_32880 [Myxococcaceae bacterium]|jgi:hypothetical protein
MNLTSKLVAVSMFALVGCGGMEGMEGEELQNPEAPAQETAEEIATAEQALTSADIQCGKTHGFPTWAGWGQTTVNMNNLNTTNGSTINVMIQAGFASPEYFNVSSNTRIVRGFGGFTLNVTHLGWTNSSGVYTSCLNNTVPPAGAPLLRVQTW